MKCAIAISATDKTSHGDQAEQNQRNSRRCNEQERPEPSVGVHQISQRVQTELIDRIHLT